MRLYTLDIHFEDTPDDQILDTLRAISALVAAVDECACAMVLGNTRPTDVTTPDRIESGQELSAKYDQSEVARSVPASWSVPA